MNTRNTTDRKRSALVLLPMLFMNASVEAFQTSTMSPISPSTICTNNRGGRSSHLQATPLHELPLPIDTLDPEALSIHAHAVHGFLQHHTSLLLSDAAVATAGEPMTALENFEATQEAIAADEGWWAAYLNIFKTTIELIHSSIDGPVHKLGWQGGTWGFSIALFTAGKSSISMELFCCVAGTSSNCVAATTRNPYSFFLPLILFLFRLCFHQFLNLCPTAMFSLP
jgi:hypothetical protein